MATEHQSGPDGPVSSPGALLAPRVLRQTLVLATGVCLLIGCSTTGHRVHPALGPEAEQRSALDLSDALEALIAEGRDTAADREIVYRAVQTHDEDTAESNYARAAITRAACKGQSHPELRAQGQDVGRKRVARLMTAAGLRGRRPPRWCARRHRNRHRPRSPISCTGSSKPLLPTGCGSATSPTSARGRAGCTWRRSSTSSRVACSDSRWPITCEHRSCATR
jgi:hypothetical protein